MFRRRSVQLFVMLVGITCAAVYAVQGLGTHVSVIYPETQISRNDGRPGEKFGFNVAGDGDTFIASTNPYFGTETTPAVYVFTRSGDQWLQQAKLTRNDERQDSEFGDIDISSNTVVFTDPKAKSLYVFVREGTIWTLQAKLSAPANSKTSFGRKVAIDGDTLVVSEERAVHVYTRQSGTTTWSYQAKLTPPGDSEEYPAFGLDVDISGDTIVVGIARNNGGSAIVFARRPGTQTWVQQAELTPPREQPRTGDGGSVSIDENRILIGSYGEKLGDESVATGAAYIFERDPDQNTWTQVARLVPQGARKEWLARYGFGIGTAIEGNSVAILAKSYSSLFSGVEAPVYLFQRQENGQWQQQAKILTSSKFPSRYGFFSVAAWENTIAAGEIFAKNKQEIAVGAVHIVDVLDLDGRGGAN